VKKTRSPWDGQRETLDDLSEAVHYNRWIYSNVERYLGRRVLEVGCGTGNLTGFFARGRKVLAVDIHEGYLRAAKKRWGGEPRISFGRYDLKRGLGDFRAFKPDTLVTVNVLEHIEGDQKFIEAAYGLLPPGGRLLVFVPAFQWLYGSMDKSYGHHRRYTKRTLNQKLSQAGFRVEYCRYLNLLGVFGWWVNGKLLGRKIIPKAQMLLYDRILKYVTPVEKYLPKPLGLSLLSVGVKAPSR